jgi:hypothetical protein
MEWTLDRPLTHPGARQLTARLVKGLSGSFSVRRRRRIIFVCGGSLDPVGASLRANFVAWASKTVEKDAFLLRSEIAYAAATQRGGKFINLSEFETVLATLSDCVLIFPESPGSYSEVGIFASRDRIKDKTLVANDSSHEWHDSFLTLGPIHAINKGSLFNPSVDFDSKRGPDPTFPERVWARIDERTKHVRLAHKPSLGHFAEMPATDRMAIVAGILNFTGIARFGDLLDIVRAVYPKKKNDARVLRNTIGLLSAMGQISIPTEQLYRTKATQEFSLDVDFKAPKLMAQFRNFWMKEFPNLWGY